MLFAKYINVCEQFDSLASSVWWNGSKHIVTGNGSVAIVLFFFNVVLEGLWA
jgi:hypothetical protein